MCILSLADYAVAYVIVLHDYWCCVDKLLMCVYSVTSVAYF